MRIHIVITFSILAFVIDVAAQFHLAETHIGRDFLSNFNWETFDDPTHGRVNYVNQQTALDTNLSFVSEDKFVMRADDTNVVPLSARGRNSIRITSHKAYADSVIVLDLSHMPEGCSTWPAFRTTSKVGPRPHGGQIDIIEGINLSNQNLVSLHTTPGCRMSPPRFQSGDAVSDNCDGTVNNNQGCGTTVTKFAAYGSRFNQALGGWYVMQRSKQSGINVWFWSRNDPIVPPSVRWGWQLVVPDSTWGIPDARFSTSDECDYNLHFDAHQMIFDLTLCGDWAGSAYSQSSCPGSCADFVNNNPREFSKAYWEINSLRVYTP